MGSVKGVGEQEVSESWKIKEEGKGMNLTKLWTIQIGHLFLHKNRNTLIKQSVVLTSH